MSPSDNRPPLKDLPAPRSMWAMCSFSPLAYLLVALAIDALFLDEERRSLIEAGPALERSLHVLMIAAAVAGQTLVAGLLWWGRTSDTGRAYHLATLASAELPVFCGFVLWTLTGDLRTIFWLGLASMILYAQAYPGRRRDRRRNGDG